MPAADQPVRILLLEDSDIDAELISRQLDKVAGLVLERAIIRREFERLLEERRFDLILSDYSVPGFDGVDALRLARKVDPAVPFIFVSGVLGEEFATETLRAGATDYVTKKSLPRLPMVVSRALIEAAERRGRLRVTEALKESEERFRVMANNAPALIWEVDTGGRITFANNRFASEFDIRPERMVAEGWRCFVHEEDWAAFERQRNALLAARATFTADVRVRTGKGVVRWVRCESRPRTGEDGTFLGYVGCAVDITGAKAARDALEKEVEARTEELKLKEEALRQAQKMEAIGQLTGGIAHDFNNMLAGIIGSADLLRKRLTTGRYDECERYVEAVVSAANRAAALTQRLLAFSRQQTLDLQAIDAAQHIVSLGELLKRTIGPSIELVTNLDADLWPASTDANQFESALLNLAINARDAMPKGGRLTIRGENVAVDSDGELAAGDYVKISISDNGSGMDAQTLAKAIDPFFTTKPIGQGTGLGLSMVYGFMSQTGGHLDIHSEVCEGTVVSLFLPRASAAGDDRGVVAVPVPAPRNGSPPGTVYVVEDEPIVRMLVVDHLEELGYRVMEAGNAEQALSALRQDDEIDLLLTDVGLPGMSGRQLAEEARKLRPELAIIFATGYADGAASRSDLVGENMDLIGKPFDVDDLAARIGALLSRAS